MTIKYRMLLLKKLIDETVEDQLMQNFFAVGLKHFDQATERGNYIMARHIYKVLLGIYKDTMRS